MADIPGMERPDLYMLPQIKDRMTFLYLEHCQINREDSADLYKAEVTIPAAFEMASKYQGDELGSAVRRRVRDLLVEKKVLDHGKKEAEKAAKFPA